MLCLALLKGSIGCSHGLVLGGLLMPLLWGPASAGVRRGGGGGRTVRTLYLSSTTGRQSLALWMQGGGLGEASC